MLHRNSALILKCRNVFKNFRRSSSRLTTPQLYVFDRAVKKIQKERGFTKVDSKLTDYLRERVGLQMYDSVIHIKRKFHKIVDLNCGRGYVSKYIDSDITDEIILCDSSQLILDECNEPKGVKCTKMVVDEENLPFEPNSIDLLLSCLALHWVNDLPGTFSQILKCLKNDGAFIGSIFGGETLYELR